jgi:hypothetical protein
MEIVKQEIKMNESRANSSSFANIANEIDEKERLLVKLNEVRENL